MEIELYRRPPGNRWLNNTEKGFYGVTKMEFPGRALEDGTAVYEGFTLCTVLMVDKVKHNIILHKARFGELQELLNLVLAETGDKLVLIEDNEVYAQSQGKDDQNMTVKGEN